MKAAIYLRVSSRGQKDASQRPDLERFIAAQKFEGVQWFTETDHGDNTARPVWGQVMELAQRRQVGAVVVWRLDRCSRSLQHMLEIFAELDRVKVEFHSVTQPGLSSGDSATARFVRNILAAAAELELETIRERTIAGLEFAKSQGRVGGRRSLRVYAEAAALVLKKGWGVKAAAERHGLTEHGLQKYMSRVGKVRRGRGVCPHGLPPSECPACEVGDV